MTAYHTKPVTLCSNHRGAHWSSSWLKREFLHLSTTSVILTLLQWQSLSLHQLLQALWEVSAIYSCTGNHSRASLVPHTSELPYVFGSLINKTPSAAALSVIMQDYWISFVNNLDPNDSHGQTRRSCRYSCYLAELVFNCSRASLGTVYIQESGEEFDLIKYCL